MRPLRYLLLAAAGVCFALGLTVARQFVFALAPIVLLYGFTLSVEADRRESRLEGTRRAPSATECRSGVLDAEGTCREAGAG